MKCYVLVLIILSVLVGCCTQSKRGNGNKKHQNMAKNYQGHFTSWTNWTKCANCWQHRMKICISPRCKDSVIDEERPCDRKRCLKQRHMRHVDKRLRILNLKTINKKHLLDYPYTNRRPDDMWSKWSNWKQCSRQCQTQRYKVCRKPGRCPTKMKTETAYCFLPNTPCNVVVEQLLTGLRQDYNILESRQEQKKPKRTKEKMCGRPNRKTRMLKIIGGQNAAKGEWPWHIAILNNNSEVFCSGTLIAPRWVLTAGHCIKPLIRVRVNEFDLSRRDGEREIQVVLKIRHHRFDHQTVDNDIGLLKLSRRVKLPVACLPKRQPKPEQTCSIMGWGTINSVEDTGYPILQKASIPIVENESCRRSYRKYFISRNMFCAGYPDGQKDTCAGDSGGGLMCRQRQKVDDYSSYLAFTVQGITSFGEGCGRRNKYGIYTNVMNYIDWIKDTMRGRYSHEQRTIDDVYS